MNQDRHPKRILDRKLGECARWENQEDNATASSGNRFEKDRSERRERIQLAEREREYQKQWRKLCKIVMLHNKVVIYKILNTINRYYTHSL